MRLYLVRHGEAVAGGRDGDRPLSEKGRRDAERMAVFLGRAGVRVARVVHSGRARARETAVALARVLGPGPVVEEASGGLDPNDPTAPIRDAIAGWDDDSMLVGHMPFMGRLAARLVRGDEERDLIAFTPATIACLARRGGGLWVVDWVLKPEVVGG